jgi:L-threonylcarbamoyladenylate synthase
MTMKTYLEKDLESARCRDEVGASLAAGGIVIFPTETFYGLGGDPRSDAVLARVAALKGRPVEHTVPLVAADPDTAAGWVHLATAAEEDLWLQLTRQFWPGPLTLIARARPGLVAGAVAAEGCLAVRVPGRDCTRTLAALCGGLLVATSANRTGHPAPVHAKDAAAGLAGPVEVLVDGGEVPGGQPSTLLDISGVKPRLIRPGAISRRELQDIVGDDLQA